jgi:G3E family GTPase
MKTTRILFIGGFLGAGKTTLLWNVAQRLVKQGLRVGLITNDQAPELVDTALLARDGLKVEEVSGSCFCCNFNGLTGAIANIRADIAADVILAEPVGSCTDLSATIMQPLKQYRSGNIRLGPLSVLADPVRLNDMLNGGTSGLHPDAAYIFRKQLEESDMILITKTDTLKPEALQELAVRTRAAFHSCVMKVSSVNGDGIDGWLQEAMLRHEAGMRLATVDYDMYARGEAVLGWLNGTVLLQGKPTDWDAFTHHFLAELGKRLDEQRYPTGHVKVIAENGSRFITGNLTGQSDTLSLRGSAGSSDRMKLTVNARVETAPDTLNQLVRETLDKLTPPSCQMQIVAWKFLQPGRPNPTHRFDKIVQMPVSPAGLRFNRPPNDTSYS